MSMTASESATRHSQGEAITAEEIQESGVHAPEDVARYALSLGDDALILAQRLGWWISRAPEMEEDIALANIALDTLGHARFFLSYAGTAWNKTEDQLAYFRNEEEFLSSRLVEQENGDFGQTIARQLLFSHYALDLYQELQNSQDKTLSAIAAKALKEVEYHVDHAQQWVLRLGLGTQESHRRIQEGITNMWPYLGELFEDLDFHQDLARRNIAVLPSTLKEPALSRITAVLEAADLAVPDIPFARSNARTGRFSEQRGYILAEMQSFARQHPDATW
ncbi:1,2-phenylacetyl-CoA epoxidase subunit PaaC [Corynebacterium poyangense]|nr:1,2-phenylacetyl-CoA epoxidase subunit PaaC [Corynebacterium poyangense]